MKKIFIIILSTFVLLSVFAQEQENIPVQENAQEEKPVQPKTSTIFVPIAAKGISVAEQNSINQRIYKKLLSDDNINLVKVSPSSISPAKNRSQALNIAKKYKADHLIYGTINFSEKTETEPLGNEGEDQYIMVETKTRTYKISISLVDVKSNKTLKRGYKTSSEENVKTNASLALLSLIKYFKENPDTPKIVAVEEKIPDENIEKDIVQEEIEEKPAEEKPVEDEKEQSSKNYTYSFGFAFNNQFPIGDYQNITGYNGGLAIYAQMQNLFVENTVLKTEFSFNNSFSLSDGVDAYNNFVFSIGGGYKFNFKDKYALTPLFSFGAITHYIDSSSVDGFFTDPMINIEVQGDYNLKPQYTIFIRPGYNLFFEKSLTAQYISLQLGFQYNL